jgi:V/A-type H+-transporting ATPase subunit D
MAIKFQYNKTSMQSLTKQLNQRIKALPTIKNKESALRLEVKKARDQYLVIEKKLENELSKYASFAPFWMEFDPGLIKIKEVISNRKKIAGVRVISFDDIIFEVKPLLLYKMPDWMPQGIEVVKKISTLEIQKKIMYNKMEDLNHARKKTTQKVNLYEKVQIPGFEDAILKIKRFLEDEDNLSKSSQKIVKNRQNAEL